MPDPQVAKLPETPVTEERVRKLAGEWASFMQIDTPFKIQFGDFAGLPEEAKANGDEFGVTFGYPGEKFIVCISDKCPADRLEQVIVHELVHVHTFTQSGPDERAAMEVATELAADLTRQLRASFEETNAAEQSEHEPYCPHAGTLGFKDCVHCNPSVQAQPEVKPLACNSNPTNFAVWLHGQMADPEFAAEFIKAQAELAVQAQPQERGFIYNHPVPQDDRAKIKEAIALLKNYDFVVLRPEDAARLTSQAKDDLPLRQRLKALAQVWHDYPSNSSKDQGWNDALEYCADALEAALNA